MGDRLKRLGCRLGYHAEVVRGTGIMGDGSDCLACGTVTYGKLFGHVVTDFDDMEIDEVNKFWEDNRRSHSR